MLLSTRQVAEKTGLTVHQICRLIREGLIKAKKVGHVYVIREMHVKNIKRRRRKQGSLGDEQPK